MLGEEENKFDIERMVEKYKNIQNAKEELKNEKEYWNSLLRKVQVKTPIEGIDIMLNGWAMYQTIVCRLFAKTGYYQTDHTYAQTVCLPAGRRYRGDSIKYQQL